VAHSLLLADIRHLICWDGESTIARATLVRDLEIRSDMGGKVSLSLSLKTDSSETSYCRDPLVSVIVPTFNRKHLIEVALQSLLNQTYSRDRYEIIVIDDGSTDGTESTIRTIVDRDPDRIRYLEENHRGPASARNLGLREAKGEIVIFTGDDCIADKELLAEHATYHKKLGNIAVLGIVKNHPNIPRTSLVEYLENSFEQFHYSAIASSNMKEVSFHFFFTSNVSVRKEVLSSVGLFNELYKYPAWEDIDLGHRIQKRLRIPIVFNENAVVYHCHPTSLIRAMKRELMRGREYVLYRKLNSDDRMHASELLSHSFLSVIARYDRPVFLLFRLVLSLARFVGYIVGSVKYRNVNIESCTC